MPFAKAGFVLGGALALALAATTSAAALVRISGSGLWNEAGPATDVSAPGQTWSFSFLLPDSVSNPTDQATQFVYSLGGAATTMTLSSVEFFPTELSGFFDLSFVVGGREGKFIFLTPTQGGPPAPDVGSDGQLVLGTFATRIVEGRSRVPFPSGLGVLTLESTSPGAVPEPGAWALMILGFGLAGTALRRSNRAAVA